MNSSSPELIACDGLDGANPLAFLAALGAFRALDETSPDSPVRMHWETRRGAWRPLLSFETPTTPNELLVRLDTALRAHAGHAALHVDNNLKVPPTRYRQYCCEAVEAWFNGDSRSADFAAAFGNELFTDNDGKFRTRPFAP